MTARPHGDVAVDERLLQPEIGELVRTVDAEAVVGDLGGVAPADAAVKVDAAARVAPRIGAEREELVVLERIQAFGVPMRPVAVELAVAAAQREPAAAVD